MIGLDAPSDVADGDIVDWRILWSVFQSNMLYISYETQSPIDFASHAWRYGVFVDKDNDASTGFRGTSGHLAFGAEYLIEGAFVYQYAGNGLSWSWNYIGSATTAIAGARLEMGIPGAWLGLSGSPRIKLMFFGNNPTTPDYAREDRAGFPCPADAIKIDGEFSDWNNITPIGTDTVNDVSSGDPVNWVRLRARGTNGTLYLSYETQANIDFAKHSWRYNIFIDSDNNNRSGFRGLPGGSGVEHLIQGGTLYRYTGTGYTWSWSPVCSLSYATSTTRLEVAIAAEHLGLDTFFSSRFLLYGDNPTTADYAPNHSPGFFYSLTTQGSVRCQSMAIPAYFYPGPLWAQATTGAPTVEIMVMNPMNGPGSAWDPLYGAAVSNAQAAGIYVVGYVHTSYGARDINIIKAEIDAYETWYQVDGIFLDETASSSNLVAFYRAIDDHIRSYPGNITILNPGVYPDESYMGAGDIIMAFEGSYSTYINPSNTIPNWARSYSPWRFWHAVYAASNQARMNTAVNKSRALNAAYLYVTQDVLPNPWDTLPSYWSSELNKIRELCP
jgi:hypothetical protein